MLREGLVLSVLVGLALSATIPISTLTPPAPFNDDCQAGQNLYPSAKLAPKIYIDMNLPPYNRWQAVAVQYKQPIQSLIQLLFDKFTVIFPDFVHFVDVTVGSWITLMPQPYRDEIQGIADAIDVPVGQIIIFNLFYEIHSLCTAVVAVDQTGHVIKGRNMDFGMWMGFEQFNGTYQWVLQQRLVPVAVHTEYMYGNVSSGIHSLSFVGYVGIFEGYKMGKFSISMNTRFFKIPKILEGGIFQVAEWVMGLRPNAKFCTFAIRDTLFGVDTYQDAKVAMITQSILAPAYYILAGVQPNEGAIVSRGPMCVEYLTELGLNNDPAWYLLQTNYDQNMPVLYLDNRRAAGHTCMDKMTQANLNIPNLYAIMSSKSTLNKQTITTVMTDVANGIFEVYLQNCPDPCWFT